MIEWGEANEPRDFLRGGGTVVAVWWWLSDSGKWLPFLYASLQGAGRSSL